MIQRLKDRGAALLQWSERYTKTDMRYVVRGSFWLLLGQAILSLSSFGLAVAFANLLPKETYGTYKYILSIAGLFAGLVLPGANVAIMRAVARGMEGSVLPVAVARAKWGLGGALLIILIAGYYFFMGNPGLSVSLLIVAVFLPIFDTFAIYSPFLRGKRDFRLDNICSAVIQLISVAALIGTALYTANLYALLIAYFGSYTVTRFLCFRFILRSLNREAPEDPEALSYSAHLSVIGVLNGIANNIDKVALFHFLGATEVAVYTVATAPGDQAKSVVGLLSTLIFPKLAGQSEEAARRSVTRACRWFAAASATVIFTYIILAPFIFSVFFPAYHEALLPSQLFALSLLVFTFEPVALFISAKGYVKEQYVVNTVTAVFLIGALMILTAQFGLMGAIVARIGSRVLNTGLYLLFYKTSAPLIRGGRT